ncbi:MAG: hypothetical protein IJR47_03330, partial [Clostridia bacterium]|nr:hypothetical protein [Clostridia bacterium]
TADTALPIAGARVSVYKEYISGKELIKTLNTDLDGETEPISLKTAPILLSQSPSEEEPYFVYDLLITHPYYQGKLYVDVPIFPNTTTIQPVSLIPLQTGEDPDILEYIIEKEPSDL